MFPSGVLVYLSGQSLARVVGRLEGGAYRVRLATGDVRDVPETELSCFQGQQKSREDRARTRAASQAKSRRYDGKTSPRSQPKAQPQPQPLAPPLAPPQPRLRVVDPFTPAWKRLLLVGSLYMDGRLFTARGLFSLWSLLMDDASIAWFAQLRIDDAQSQRIMFLFADVWWSYLQTKAPGDCADMECALVVMESLFRVEGPEADRFAERFAALLFQLVVQERHDQSLISVTVDYDPDNHYFQRVDKAKNGVVVSNNALMQNLDHPPARKAVDRATRPLGRIVSLVLSQNNTEFVRLRKAPKVFRCENHATSTMSGMTKCTKCHRLHEGKLHFYDPFSGDYRPRDDFFTTIDPGEFKAAEQLAVGDPLLFHENGRLCQKKVTRLRVQGTNVVAQCGDSERAFKSKAQAYVCAFDSVVDVVRMLKADVPGRPSVLDTMRLSRPFKSVMRHRYRRESPRYRWTYRDIAPMRYKSRRFWEYLVYQWCKRCYFCATDFVRDKNLSVQREREYARRELFGDAARVATQAVCLV